MSAAPAQLNFQKACADDADALVALRIEAMSESLERIGRFNLARARTHPHAPARVRQRFLDGFAPLHTQHIAMNGERAGFFVLKPLSQGLLLDHLYIRPTHQGRGIGAAVLAHVFAIADASRLAVSVGALRGSDSNRFLPTAWIFPGGGRRVRQALSASIFIIQATDPAARPPMPFASTPTILQLRPLGFPWPTLDPFLFCVHHDDAYPRGNAQFGPDASLAGRSLGQDFAGKEGWRMYHGMTVPGFPAHPHRGFETVTVVRKGLIDHADSLGATARYGGGDVQWLTTGRGIVHAEMFPLLNPAAPNPLELFQIWLNLPARSKMVEPHFTMFWAEQVPQYVATDTAGRSTEVACIAGRLLAEPLAPPPAPPPDSWASQPEADLAIWTLKMAPGARWVLPAAAGEVTRRQLYFFKGASLTIDGQAISQHAAIELRATQAAELVNGEETSEFLMLQGRPIGEPVAQHGPFVMNTQAELQQAFDDYRRTEFGGWPWGDSAPVHGPDGRRFARQADGRIETPPGQGE